MIAMEAEIHHQKVIKSYARQAHKYDRRFKNYLEGSLGAALLAMDLRGTENILDVACGTGELEKKILEKFPHQKIWGIDLSENMLSQARQKVNSYPNVSFEKADSRKLPFASASFDVVVSSSALHYMKEPEKVFSECARVLSSGGQLIIVDWCRDFLFAKIYHLFRKSFVPAHHDVYGLEKLKEMMSLAGLAPIDEKTFTVRFFWKMMMVKALKKGKGS